jgi:hypothetical protein
MITVNLETCFLCLVLSFLLCTKPCREAILYKARVRSRGTGIGVYDYKRLRLFLFHINSPIRETKLMFFSNIMLEKMFKIIFLKLLVEFLILGSFFFEASGSKLPSSL